jgi:hypothetical protein
MRDGIQMAGRGEGEAAAGAQRYRGMLEADAEGDDGRDELS